MRQQPFASPEEALEHFGIKGMHWGVRKEPGEFANWGKPYSSVDGLGHGSKEFELKKPKQLRVDHSAGFADVRPADGYSSPRAKQVHDDLVSSLSAMRQEHPSVAKLKIVVVPASHVVGGPGRSAQAAVLHTKPGEVFIAYNDKLKDLSPRQQKRWEKWVPGTKHEGYVANHEMGHVLAVGGKITPPCWELTHAKTLSEAINRAQTWHNQNEDGHKALFAKHGVTFTELSKLSPYAATSASEAFAEATGHYYTPETNRQMSPELRTKVKAMLDDVGGKQT